MLRSLGASDLVNNAANGELLVMVETIKSNARWLTKIVLADSGYRSEQVFVELEQRGRYSDAQTKL
jgi:hypothetical protein